MRGRRDDANNAGEQRAVGESRAGVENAGRGRGRTGASATLMRLLNLSILSVPASFFAM